MIDLLKQSIVSAGGNPEAEYQEISGFPGYAIGSDGSAWSARQLVGCGNLGGFTSRISSTYKRLKPTLMKVGYLSFSMRLNGVTYRKYVHSLVLEAFVGPRPAGAESCHNNGNRTDNRLVNLRWDSPGGNHADMKIHGTSQCGERHGNSRLHADDVRLIRQCYRNGDKSSAIAARFGIRASYVNKIARLEAWPHVEASDEYRQWLSSWSGSKGERSAKAKLKEHEVQYIKNKLSLGHEYIALAEQFNVSASAIYAIDAGLTWKHVA